MCCRILSTGYYYKDVKKPSYSRIASSQSFNRALLRGWTMALSGVCAAVSNLGVVLEIFTSLV